MTTDHKYLGNMNPSLAKKAKCTQYWVSRHMHYNCNSEQNTGKTRDQQFIAPNSNTTYLKNMCFYQKQSKQVSAANITWFQKE